MTREEQKRASAIIRELARLSRNGWRDAKPCDYAPLEQELRELYRKKAN